MVLPSRLFNWVPSFFFCFSASHHRVKGIPPSKGYFRPVRWFGSHFKQPNTTIFACLPRKETHLSTVQRVQWRAVDGHAVLQHAIGRLPPGRCTLAIGNPAHGITCPPALGKPRVFETDLQQNLTMCNHVHPHPVYERFYHIHRVRRVSERSCKTLSVLHIPEPCP